MTFNALDGSFGCLIGSVHGDCQERTAYEKRHETNEGRPLGLLAPHGHDAIIGVDGNERSHTPCNGRSSPVS
jgi:hypothetical protein